METSPLGHVRGDFLDQDNWDGKQQQQQNTKQN